MIKGFATILLIIAVCCFSFNKGYSQNCSCSDLLSTLINKVQTNYAGYLHKVKESKDSTAYIQLKQRLIKKATSTSFRDCYFVMTEYTKYFKDGHLFVMEAPNTSATQSDSLRQFVKRMPVTNEMLSKIKIDKPADPLEGIWYDATTKLAIVKTGENRYAAITLENPNPKWERGMVKFEALRTSPGKYFITILRGDYSPIRFEDVQIYKDCLLGFGVYKYAKESATTPEKKYIDSRMPQLPYFKQLDEKTAVITVPSALIDARILDSVVRANDKIINSTENLIIDLRGNLGGNYIWRSLAVLANTKPYANRKVPGEEDFLMYASPDNADYVYRNGSYYRQIKDSAGTAYYDKLTEKIRSSGGKVVGFSFYDPEPDTSRRPIREFPKRIGVITDRATASAAEAIVLSMKENSNKITYYGANTYGMIDYMNVNTRLIECGTNNNYYYGYATFFSPEISKVRHNTEGIKPDIYVPANVNDWIEWVRKDLAKRK